MPQAGYTGPWSSWEWTGLNFENQIWSEKIVMPEAGVITGAGVYVGGRGGPVTGNICVWDYAGNLLRSVSVAFPTGSDSTGGRPGRRSASIPWSRRRAGSTTSAGGAIPTVRRSGVTGAVEPTTTRLPRGVSVPRRVALPMRGRSELTWSTTAAAASSDGMVPTGSSTP